MKIKCINKILVIISMFFIVGCAVSDKENNSQKGGAFFQKTAAEFLEKYTTAYNQKNPEELLKLTSNKIGLLSKPALEELFLSIDGIKVISSVPEITDNSVNDTIIFQTVITNEIQLGEKNIKDSRKMEFTLVKIQEKYLLFALQTKEIY